MDGTICQLPDRSRSTNVTLMNLLIPNTGICQSHSPPLHLGNVQCKRRSALSNLGLAILPVLSLSFTFKYILFLIIILIYQGLSYPRREKGVVEITALRQLHHRLQIIRGERNQTRNT